MTAAQEPRHEQQEQHEQQDWPAVDRLDAARMVAAIRSAAVRRADQLLDAIPADVLEPLWAHLSLRMADWSIRHFSPADTEHWLGLAETRIS